jgi:hypothetical protein
MPGGIADARIARHCVATPCQHRLTHLKVERCCVADLAQRPEHLPPASLHGRGALKSNTRGDGGLGVWQGDGGNKAADT